MSIRGFTFPGSPALALGVALLAIAGAACGAGIRSFYIDEAASPTGYTIEAEWEATGLPSAYWDDGTPVDLAAAPQGFELLDGTLAIATSIPDGQMKLQVRVAYDPLELRAQGGRAQKPPVLMRRTQVGQDMRWRPITDLIRVRGLRARRRIGPADFMLGHYGVDWDNEYVWAVIDVPGTFTVGVPEPVSLLCLAGGIGMLVLRRPRRTSA